MGDEPLLNAFTINRLHGAAFPFSAALGIDEGGVYRFDPCPVKLDSIADLIARHGQRYVALFDVSSVVEPLDRLTLEQAVREMGLLKCGCADIVVMEAADLAQFFDVCLHYNCHLFDLPEVPTAEALLERYLDIEPDTTHFTLRLSQLPGASFFLDSHDDCYLLGQSRSATLPREILRRSLGIYAFTALHNRGRPVAGVTPPSDEVLDGLLGLTGDMTLLPEHTRDDSEGLIMGFSNGPNEDGGSVLTSRPAPTRVVRYLVDDDIWRV